MKALARLWVTALAAGCSEGAAVPAPGQGGAALVELFTSQG